MTETPHWGRNLTTLHPENLRRLLGGTLLAQIGMVWHEYGTH
jgi:hypothetical protein